MQLSNIVTFYLFLFSQISYLLCKKERRSLSHIHDLFIFNKSTPLRVLFAGDSITDGARERRYDRYPDLQLGQSYPNLVAAILSKNYPSLHIEYGNEAIAGTTLGDIVDSKRLLNEVKAFNPNIVSIFAGINDVWSAVGKNLDFDHIAFENRYESLIHGIRHLGKIKIVIIEPYMFPQGSAIKGQENQWNLGVSMLQKSVEKIGTSVGVDVIRLQSVFNAAINSTESKDFSLWSFDGIHPTSSGKMLIAEEWLKWFFKVVSLTNHAELLKQLSEKIEPNISSLSMDLQPASQNYTRRISVAVIADILPDTSNINQMRVYNHLKNFTKLIENAFASSMHPGIQYWPPIYSRTCKQSEKKFDQGRGSNIAHKEAWSAFYLSAHADPFRSNDVLVLFEDDAHVTFEGAEIEALHTVMKMTEDMIYLGYCYKDEQLHPKVSKQAPYCNHAYAMTVQGAKKLIDLFDSCGPLSDVQLSEFANGGKITWGFSDRVEDTSFLNNYYQTYGAHKSGWFHFGGLFTQAKFDEYIVIKDGDIACTKSYGRTIFLMKHSSWEIIPSMDVFNSLGLRQSDVKFLTDWQFKQYPLKTS